MSNDTEPKLNGPCQGCDWPRSSQMVLTRLDENHKMLSDVQGTLTAARMEIVELKTTARLWGMFWGAASGVGGALLLKLIK